MPPNNGCQDGWIQAVFGTLSESTRKDVKSTVIAVQFVVILFLGFKWIQTNERRVVDKEKIIKELRRQLAPQIDRKIEREVDKKTESVIKAVDETGKSLQELTETVKQKLTP